MAQRDRAFLKNLVLARLRDNTSEAITPADLREVFDDLIDSAGLVLQELQGLGGGTDPAAGLPAWSATTTYAQGANVKFDGKIWESRIGANLNIPPSEGAVWREISATHLPGTDTQLRRPDGTPLTAAFIAQKLAEAVLISDLTTTLTSTWSSQKISSELAGRVRTVNSVTPDANGNVNVAAGGSGTGVFPPVQTLAALKALDTTAAATWPDKWLINVEDLAMFYLDRDSTATADDVAVVAPTAGIGRWIRRTNLPGFTMDASGENLLDYTPADSSNTTGFWAGLLGVTGKLKLKAALDALVSRLPAAVRNALLTGVDVNLPGTVAATDSVLQASGKLQRQATANNTEARTFTLNPDYAGLATTARFTFNRRFTITSSPSLNRIATVTYQVGAGTIRTAIADANTDIGAATLPFELAITITFSASQNQGNLSLPCFYD